MLTVPCACSESGALEETSMSSPALVWVTEDGALAIVDVFNVDGYKDCCCVAACCCDSQDCSDRDLCMQ